jgi:probable rRNA maturation factor
VTVAVTIENRSSWTIDERAAVGVICGAFAAEGISEGEVGLALVEPAEMAELNGTYRARPKPTDVLSFPIDGDDELEAGLPRQLGDVVICPEVSAAEGTPAETLLVHSVLHLLGYDHEDADDSVMLDRQDELLKGVEPVAISPAER